MTIIRNLFAAVILTVIGWFPSWAGSPLDHGAQVQLESDEGLLLIAVESDMPLASIDLRKVSDGRAFDVLKDISGGQTRYFLYRLEAGEYEVAEIYPDHKANTRVSRPPLDEARFRVQEGRINYPGTLVVRISELVTTAEYHRHNRSSQAVLWLREQFPGLYASTEFTYAGEVPDDFPAYFRSLTSATGERP